MEEAARGWCASTHCGGAAVVKLRDLEVFLPFFLPPPGPLLLPGFVPPPPPESVFSCPESIRRPWRPLHDRHRQRLASSAARPLPGTVAVLSGPPRSVYQRLPVLGLEAARLLQLQHDHRRQRHDDERTDRDEVGRLTGDDVIVSRPPQDTQDTQVDSNQSRLKHSRQVGYTMRLDLPGSGTYNLTENL